MLLEAIICYYSAAGGILNIIQFRPNNANQNGAIFESNKTNKISNDLFFAPTF